MSGSLLFYSRYLVLRRKGASQGSSSKCQRMRPPWCKEHNTTQSSQGMAILPGLVFIWLIEAATVVTWIWTARLNFRALKKKRSPSPPSTHRTFPSAKKRSPERRASYSRPRTWIRKRSTFSAETRWGGPPSPEVMGYHPRYWSWLGKNSKTPWVLGCPVFENAPDWLMSNFCTAAFGLHHCNSSLGDAVL